MNMTFTESSIEQATIDWLKELGYEYAFGLEIAFDGVVRVVRLRDGMSSLPRVMRGEVRVK